MNIKKKLIVSYTMILVLMFGLGISSIVTLNLVNNTSTVIAVQWLPRLNCAQSINYNLARYRTLEFQHIILTDSSGMSTLETRMDDMQATIEGLIKQYKGYTDDSNIDLISNDWPKYVVEHKKMITASRALDTDAAMAVIKGDSLTEFNDMAAAAQAIIDENTQNSDQTSAQGDQMYALMRTIIISLLAGVCIFGIIVEVVMVRSIRRPLKTLETKLQELVDKGGDLTQQIDIKSKDEIGLLANQINRFIQNIRAIIIEVNGATAGVEKAVETVVTYMYQLGENVEASSATVEELSAGMEETAATAQEVNSSAGEIEDAATSMADRAQQGAISAGEISNRAQGLKEDAIKSRDSAHTIYQSTKASLEDALEKSNAINQISVLSDTILQISGQTNLLALNAAIEAARAGEAGKGFAVVADEIRTLAENSKNTVTEIQQVAQAVVASVDDLANSTRAFMGFFDSTVVRDYSSMVTTGETYGNDGEFVNNLVSDFSATSEELTATIEGIKKAMGEVATTVNEGAGGTQDIAEKIAEIVRMVDQVKVQMNVGLENTKALQTAVSKFTV